MIDYCLSTSWCHLSTCIVVDLLFTFLQFFFSALVFLRMYVLYGDQNISFVYFFIISVINSLFIPSFLRSLLLIVFASMIFDLFFCIPTSSWPQDNSIQTFKLRSCPRTSIQMKELSSDIHSNWWVVLGHLFKLRSCPRSSNQIEELSGDIHSNWGLVLGHPYRHCRLLNYT